MAAQLFSGGVVVVDDPASSKVVDGVTIPLILSPDPSSPSMSMDEAVGWAARNQDAIERALCVHGAILFRGFPFDQPQDFGRMVAAFKGWEDLSYRDSLSYSVRTPICDRGEQAAQLLHEHLARALGASSMQCTYYC